MDKIKLSFEKVKRDIDAVKLSFTDWVLFLKRRNDVLEERMRVFEKRVEDLESQKQVIVY